MRRHGGAGAALGRGHACRLWFFRGILSMTLQVTVSFHPGPRRGFLSSVLLFRFLHPRAPAELAPFAHLMFPVALDRSAPPFVAGPGEKLPYRFLPSWAAPAGKSTRRRSKHYSPCCYSTSCAGRSSLPCFREALWFQSSAPECHVDDSSSSVLHITSRYCTVFGS